MFTGREIDSNFKNLPLYGPKLGASESSGEITEK